MQGTSQAPFVGRPVPRAFSPPGAGRAGKRGWQSRLPASQFKDGGTWGVPRQVGGTLMKEVAPDAPEGLPPPPDAHIVLGFLEGSLST